VTPKRLGEFLRAHRQSVRPTDPHKRRTPGLRREEVAQRAAISTDYYARLEQGRERWPSPRVLDSLAVALELSMAEADYLHGLVRPPNPRTRCAEAHGAPNEFLSLVMQSWPRGPAYIVNHRCDVLARNQPARELLEHSRFPDNILHMLFLDPAAPEMWANWDAFARFFVGGIRKNSGPAMDDDPATAALIAKVAEQSPAFARLWDSHKIVVGDHKEKLIRHKRLGEVRFDFELLTAIDAPNQFLVLHRSH
jgi:transcriptional regulator with XRE-family HTH domain